MSNLTLTERLSPILSRSVSETDRWRAALLFLDWTGCAVAGQVEPSGQKMTAAFLEETGSSTRIGAGKASPLMAALHNGSLGNVLEMDDVDRQAVLHAAPTIIPAALSVAEYVGADRDRFLGAIVVGYETTIRIGRAVGAGHYAFWHNTATCGPFGAAAAACYLLENSDLVSALGLAGTQAAGLWQTRHEPDSMAKQLHSGHAAHAGVLAALLSVQGFQGPRSILEGEQGFFKAMCPGANPEAILDDPEADWLLHETSLKPYPACRHAHPAIDAALKAYKEFGTPDSDVLIETYADALKFCDRSDPKSTIEAKFSLQHSVALALTKGVPELSDFDRDVVEGPVSALRLRVRVKESPEFTDAYPKHYGASVTINGKKFTAHDAYGDPEVPMSEDAITDKAVGLMTHAGVSAEDANRIAQAALRTDLITYLDLLP